MIILDFEKPILELESKIKELKSINTGNLDIVEDIKRFEQKLKKLLKQIYKDLTPWQKVKVARHPARPQTADYVNAFISDFVPLSGDRHFGEDKAILAGIGKFDGISVAILGHQKGKDTEERIKNNFGMPNPEGYRKAYRIMELADKFKMPILSFVDTAGAYPGVGAEERGQAEAIAKCIERFVSFNQPIIATIIGEGGSGGAVALAVANCILMLEHSVYSVISPEGCASILWRSADAAEEAANALKLTSQDLLKFKVIDEVIDEPLGGAHREPNTIIKSVESRIRANLKSLLQINDFQIHRQQKFLNFGKF